MFILIFPSSDARQRDRSSALRTHQRFFHLITLFFSEQGLDQRQREVHRCTRPARSNEHTVLYHGVFKHLDDHVVGGKLVEDTDAPKFFDQEKLDLLRERQINTVRYLDGVFEKLYDMVPKNTFVTVTSDLGELFGDEGYFGHGPIMHEKVFEVPFLEAQVR